MQPTPTNTKYKKTKNEIENVTRRSSHSCFLQNMSHNICQKTKQPKQQTTKYTPTIKQEQKQIPTQRKEERKQKGKEKETKFDN